MRTDIELLGIANQNRAIFEKGSYMLNGELVKLHMSQLKTRVYDKKPDIKIKNNYNTIITVTNNDSITECLIGDDSKTVVLNFASYKYPGGGYLTGSKAQEECLCRQTTLYPELEKQVKWYDNHRRNLNNGLYGNDTALTENVEIIRNSNNELINSNKFIGIITSAAVNAKTVRRFKPQLENKINECMLERLDTIMAVAYVNDYETLILGAYGCGVFGNKVKDVAEMCKELLSNKYKGAFKKVAFPIYGNIDNLKVFKDVFKNSLVV